MAHKRELRLAMRPATTPLDRVLTAADHVRELKTIADRGIRYVVEIYAPNIREPFSISNRRMDLVDLVRAYQVKRGLRRAA